MSEETKTFYRGHLWLSRRPVGTQNAWEDCYELVDFFYDEKDEAQKAAYNLINKTGSFDDGYEYKVKLCIEQSDKDGCNIIDTLIGNNIVTSKSQIK